MEDGGPSAPTHGARIYDDNHERTYAAVIRTRKFPIICSLLAMLVLPRISAAQVGQVAKVNGNAELRRASQLYGVGAAMPVFLNDQVSTDAASSLAINLNGGSSLELGESSTITLDEHVLPPTQSAFKTQISLLTGKVRSVVPHVLGAADFEVHTPNAVAAVRGTDFVVSFSDGQKRFGYPGCETFTDLSVHTGTVAIANMANPNASVNVPEGFSTTVACANAPLPPGPSGLEGLGSGGVTAPGAVTGPPPPAAAPPPAPPPPPPPPPPF
jgi:hypothetical protein